MNQIALHGRKPRSGTGVRRSVDYSAQPKAAALGSDRSLSIIQYRV